MTIETIDTAAARIPNSRRAGAAAAAYGVAGAVNLRLPAGNT